MNNMRGISEKLYHFTFFMKSKQRKDEKENA
jgi:hypothetical protein